jgi:hypothetical protein
MSCRTYDPCLDSKLNQIGSYASAARQSAQNSAASAAAADAEAAQAASSAAAAAASAAAAAISAEIAGIYLGAFAVPPTTDNQGGPLQDGMLYYNTVSNTIFAWNGTVWVENGNFNEFTNFSLPSATPVPAANLRTGQEYEIVVVGNTNWTAIGAPAAQVGVRFTKNAVAATGTGTARVTRDLVTRFADVVNVKDFGAVGGGVTDDTAAIQAAANASSGGSVFIPAGNYKVTGTINGDFYTFGVVTIIGGDINYISNLAQIEVVDYNKEPIYRKYSEYQPTSNLVWIFSHTGQSLAEGGVGNDPVAGLIPYPANIEMLINGPVGLTTNVIGPSIQTLSEKSRVTIASSYMRKTLTDISGVSDDVVFHGQAWGGKNYNSLKKGGSTGVYEKIISQSQNILSSKQTIIYKGISVIHGEQDGLDNNTNYAANLNEWKTDFNTDFKLISGQTEDIPMFLCQVGSSSGYGYTGGITSTGFPSQLEQLKAHEIYNDIYLVCPKYQLDYFDHSHITNNAQVLLGEYYAKAFKKVIQNGNFDPLRPSTIVGAGNQVTISFVGRVGNLVFDTTNVIAATNQGFAYSDDSGNTITNVQIVNNQVVITLSGNIGANAVVGYAYNNGSGGATNQVNGLGARGNLRDSDTETSSFTGQNLYNWCVIFKKTI